MVMGFSSWKDPIILSSGNFGPGMAGMKKTAPHVGRPADSMSSVRSTSDGRGPVTRNRVPDREEQGKPSNDARRGRCHPLE